MGSRGNSNANDNYWKAGEGRREKTQMLDRLQEAGYRVNRHASCDAVYDQTLRIDTHQICYERCSSAELSRFKADRGISVALSAKQQKGPKAKRIALEEALYAADRQLRFERFLDLPPELRNNIYEYAMAHFPEKLVTPSEPPLARVCRQLREETLPLFYATHLFEMEYQLSSTTGEYRCRANLASFLMALDYNDGLRYIRRLTFKFYGWKGALHGGRCRFMSRFDVALCDNDGGKSSYTLYDMRPNNRPARSATVDQDLQDILEQIDSRAEGRVLTMLDLRAFRQVGEKDIVIQSKDLA